MEHPALEQAAAALRGAEALVVTAGAGMGVDSGLPDFRGTEGFWRAYPPLRDLGLSFEQMANPAWFDRDPALAWGFYGHRLNLYRRTAPHAGYAVLRRWARRMDTFVFTSNVDGAFQRAGFDEERIHEVHGAIDWMQCTGGDCSLPLRRRDDLRVDVDETTFRARGELPRCPRCESLLRPNILMFNDGGWISERSDAQARRLRAWLESVAQEGRRAVVVELGAGVHIATVRWFSERTAKALGATLVRVNLRDHDVPGGAVALPMGAMDALCALDARLERG